MITEICDDLNSLSYFPGNYETYFDYFQSTYQYTIVNKDQSLLLAKPLSSRLNCLKPRGPSAKRNREVTFENYTIHFVPEMLVKQDFPAALWIQAKILPSVIDRVMQLLRAEELRQTIAKDMKFVTNVHLAPLILDKNLLNYNIEHISTKSSDKDEVVEQCELKNISSILTKLNTDVASKMLNAEYQWDKSEEPVDIERTFDVTALDIENYERFISQKNQPVKVKQPPNVKSNILALTFDKDYIEKKINMLEIHSTNTCPDLADIFKALATAKCDEIVNLERLETLGDSFLKLSISLYINLKYPKFDEGLSTSLKSKLVSNKNLYYLAEKKKLGEYIKFIQLNPKQEWCPPGYYLPPTLSQMINSNVTCNSTLLYLDIPREEQVTGLLSSATDSYIVENCKDNISEEVNPTVVYYAGYQDISDKFVSDAVEALIGAHIQSAGFEGECL